MNTGTAITNSIDLSIPGRLCLFGEHSDWAGSYTRFNSNIVPGQAIIVVVEQNIKAKAEKSKNLKIQSVLPDGTETDVFEAPMDVKVLKDIAAK